MNKQYYIYLITNYKNTALYTGVTSNLEKRVYEHEKKVISGFTAKYNCNKLVYYEVYESVEAAIKRERAIKGWIRNKKNALIETVNPDWTNLKHNQFQFPLDPSSQSSSG